MIFSLQSNKSIWNNEKIWIFVIPLLLFLFNIALRIFYLNYPPVSNDEPFSIYHAQMDIPSIVYQLSLGNNPPLFEVLLHYWIKIFGISTFSVRFLPMLFSAATAVVVYQIGYRFFNKNVAIWAALLFSFSNSQFFFTHQARVYTLFTLLASLSFYAFLRLYEKPEKKLLLFWLFFWNILLIYSHYFGLWIPVIQAFACIVIKEVRQRIFKSFCIVSIALLLAYMPFLMTFISRFLVSASKGTWVQPVGFEAIYLLMLRFFNAPIVAIVFILTLLTAIVKWSMKKTKIPVECWIIVLWFVVPFCAMFLLSMKYLPHPIPMFLERYLLFVTPALFLLVVVSVNYLLEKPKFSSAFLVMFVILLGIKSDPKIGEYWPTNQETNFLKIEKTPETVVYFCPQWYIINFSYHYNKQYFADYDTHDITRNMRNHLSDDHIFGLFNYNEIDTVLLKNSKKAIYIDAGADAALPGNNIRKFLNSHFAKETLYDFSNGFHSVYVYER
jgi:mannosyltransferase